MQQSLLEKAAYTSLGQWKYQWIYGHGTKEKFCGFPPLDKEYGQLLTLEKVN